MTDAFAAPETRTTFEIPEVNFPKFEKQVEKLSRRSMKLIGQPIKPLVFGYEYKDGPKGTKYKVFTVLFTAEVPKIDGWAFIARLDHSSETGNIVRSVPNAVDVPEKYRLAAPSCDHCGVNRYRRDTFLLHCEATGEFKQVGSSCLIDFFGHDPMKVAKMAEFLSYAMECARGAGQIVGANRAYIDLEDYLSHSAWAIRAHGWTSAKAARENDRLTATREMAYSNMFPAPGYVADAVVPTAEDVETAQKAMEWVRGFCATGDSLNEYMHNLCVIAGSEVIEHRSMGLAASMIYAYLRDQNKLGVRQSVQVGDLKGIFGLFDKATASGLRNPAIVLMAKDDKVGQTEVRLTVATQTSRYPGTVNVTSLGSFETRDWYGRIKLDGVFESNPRLQSIPTGLADTLKAFAANPAEVAAQYGKLTGRCCVCYKALSDPRSAEVGYGKTCAAKMGWPWGAGPDGTKPKRSRKAKAETPDLLSGIETSVEVFVSENEMGLTAKQAAEYNALTDEWASVIESHDPATIQPAADAVRSFEEAHNIPQDKRYWNAGSVYNPPKTRCVEY